MPELLHMPEVAANTNDAVLASWNVELNERYSAGDTILTVETEKAVVDVEAESDGMLLRTLADEGARIDVGTPIALWGTGSESEDDIEALLASLGADAGTALTCADEPQAIADASTQDTPLPSPGATAASVGPTGNGARRFASPLARRMAKDEELDLSEVLGTGPGGRIRRRDIEATLERRTQTGNAATPGSLVLAAGSFEAYEDVPTSRMRQAIARRLTESKQTAPHFYVRGSARVDQLLTLRAELNDSGTVKVSVNDLVVKAVAAAHAQVPKLNVQWNGDSVRHFHNVDVALAVATDSGLVTPVIRGVDTMSVRELVTTTGDLVSRARARQLQQTELEGGAISVTNLGMYGTEEFSAIINPPQAAILAVGAARKEPVVEDGQLVVGTVLHVNLAVDHRPVDGATAAEWMRVFVDLLENPLQILL